MSTWRALPCRSASASLSAPYHGCRRISLTALTRFATSRRVTADRGGSCSELLEKPQHESSMRACPCDLVCRSRLPFELSRCLFAVVRYVMGARASPSPFVPPQGRRLELSATSPVPCRSSAEVSGDLPSAELRIGNMILQHMCALRPRHVSSRALISPYRVRSSVLGALGALATTARLACHCMFTLYMSSEKYRCF